MKKETPVAEIKIDEQLIADKFLPKAWIVVSVVLAVLVFFYTKMFGTTSSNDQEIWGQFGDFLGGILNPLISFLTLMVATKVWQLQQRELVKTQQALKQQAETNELQRFENTLFKLVEHCHNSIKTYSVKKSKTDVFAPSLIGLEAIEHLVSQLKVKQHFEGQLSPASVNSMIEEFNAFGFYEPYTVIKYAYVFSLKNCPIESRSSEYATMTYMLIGDETMYLCRFWAIALKDESFLELLPKDQPTGE